MTSTHGYSEGTTFIITEENSMESSKSIYLMKILKLVIASLGIITNFFVVVVFLNHKKLRRKIPNICIINQVSATTYILSLLPQQIISRNKNMFGRKPTVRFSIENQIKN